MSWGGWGEGQKKARGALMRGTPLPLPIVPLALAIFGLLLFLLGYSVRAAVEERGLE